MTADNQAPGSTKRSTWGNDYLQAFKTAGLVADEMAMQRCVVTHDQENYSEVQITVHLNPEQLKTLADIVCGGVPEWGQQ